MWVLSFCHARRPGCHDAGFNEAGRPLRLVRFGVRICLVITLATLFRILAPLGVLNLDWDILSASAAWILAFTFFLILYAPESVSGCRAGID